MFLVILLPLFSFLLEEQENSCKTYEEIYSTCLQEIYQTKFVSPNALRFETLHFKNFCNNKTKETSVCFQFKEAPCSALFLCVKKLYVVHSKKE